MSAGEGGGGAPAAAPNAFVQALAEIRRDGDWARVAREFALVKIDAENIVPLLGITSDDAADLIAQLRDKGVKSVDALLTASSRIQEDPASGDFSAKGDLASVTVKGALRQIAALRDRVKGK